MAETIAGFVTLLCLAFYFYTGLNVGRARSKFGIAAPAVSGHPDFERILRVQLNTLEWLPLFLPVLWMFCLYCEPVIGGALGLVWLIGRVLFMQGYVKAADQRSMGFLVQFGAWLVLFLGVLAAMIWRAAGWAPLL